jgi:hypothetical protein
MSESNDELPGPFGIMAGVFVLITYVVLLCKWLSWLWGAI